MTSSTTPPIPGGRAISPCRVRIRSSTPRSSSGAAVRADDRTRLVWAITSEGRVSGSINLWILGPGADEIGYDIARRLWEEGLATESAAAVVAFGFDALGLGCIEATADIRNAASGRVMEKLGMQREGAVPMNRSAQGERADGVR